MINKVLKIAKQNLLGFIVGAIIFTGVGVTAATILAGSEVSYTGSKVENASNIQQAIDRLYDKATTSDRACTTGYVKQNENGRIYECIAPTSSCTGEGCKLCKRATSLHTEVCNQNSYFCSYDGYTTGDTITYGNETTTSGVLNTGDAFDCDVNGDGTYDNLTERFYFVSTKNNGIETDSNTAVLIYYNNTINGESSTSNSAWYPSNDNSHGPEIARGNLPTESQWNTRLTQTIRNITYENDQIRVENFNYSGYAARLLTYQEVNAGCYNGTKDITDNVGLSSKCKFLYENTKYSNDNNPTQGIWLESPCSYQNYIAWYVDIRYCKANYYERNYINGTSNTLGGSRPAIEVQLSEIEY